MTYLQHLPVDVIKIDRSFVANATEDGYDSTVIEAMLSIGRTLNLAVVAEGVETSAQLDYVRAEAVTGPRDSCWLDRCLSKRRN